MTTLLSGSKDARGRVDVAQCSSSKGKGVESLDETIDLWLRAVLAHASNLFWRSRSRASTSASASASTSARASERGTSQHNKSIGYLGRFCFLIAATTVRLIAVDSRKSRATRIALVINPSVDAREA
jgi:hypothetical protein